MNPPILNPSSFRQTLLKSQIKKASDLGEDQKLSLLQSMWVHRYGLETLPKREDNYESFCNENQLDDHLKEDMRLITEVENINQNIVQIIFIGLASLTLPHIILEVLDRRNG